MQRVAGKNRYPIDVVKIPMAVPLTTAFKQNIERIRRERLPERAGLCAAASTEDGNKAMKHTELRAAVLDALEKRNTGATFLMVAPLFLMRRIFRQLPFISLALNTRAKSWTAIPGRRSWCWKILPACSGAGIQAGCVDGVPDLSGRRDIPALSDLITSMVASGYDYLARL